MKGTKVMCSDEMIKQLASEILESQSYDYLTFQDAEREIELRDVKYRYDRITLRCYETNMEEQCKISLEKKIKELWDSQDIENKMRINDRKKLRREYISLQKLLECCPELKDYNIKKEERPDFVLTKNDDKAETKPIGIEVTEFITKNESVLNKIVSKSFGKNKSAKEIREEAKNEHGGKVDSGKICIVETEGGTLGYTVYNTFDAKNQFTELIDTKHGKYNARFEDFDKFILLCDATFQVAIASAQDADDLFKTFSNQDEDANGMNVYIMWEENGLKLKEYSVITQDADE